jgi:hypothetical protein
MWQSVIRRPAVELFVYAVQCTMYMDERLEASFYILHFFVCWTASRGRLCPSNQGLYGLFCREETRKPRGGRSKRLWRSRSGRLERDQRSEKQRQLVAKRPGGRGGGRLSAEEAIEQHFQLFVWTIDISWLDWAYKSSTCDVMYRRQRRHLYYGSQI